MMMIIFNIFTLFQGFWLNVSIQLPIYPNFIEMTLNEYNSIKSVRSADYQPTFTCKSNAPLPRNLKYLQVLRINTWTWMGRKGLLFCLLFLGNFEKKPYNSMKIRNRQFLLDLVAFICWQSLKHIRCSINSCLLGARRGEIEGNENWTWKHG